MIRVRLLLALLPLGVLGCASDDPEASSPVQPVVEALMDGLDTLAMRQCECLVEQGVLYDSVDACLMVLGNEPGNAECMAMALEAHGTQAQLDALRCWADHLETARACGGEASCEEIVGGACVASVTQLSCNQAVLDTLDFLLQYCPSLSMFD